MAREFLIQDCEIRSNETAGIELSVEGQNGTNFYKVTGNNIVGNGIGLVSHYNRPEYAGIVSNRFVGSKVFVLKNQGLASVVAANCYWGEPTTSELMAGVINLTKVYDTNDDAAVGPVILQPFLTTDPWLIRPSITQQPADQAALAGDTVTFSVLADGSEPLSYQWRKGNQPLPGMTNQSLAMLASAQAEGAWYNVIVSNGGGSVTSRWATLTVLTPPSITSQPGSVFLPVGSTATFHVTATGSAPLSYQWQKGGVNLANGGRISGVTAADLTITSIQTSDAADYRCVVTNFAGMTVSSNASLMVSTPPSVTQQPVSQTVVVGSVASFSVAVSGTQPITYQWLFNGAAITGATNAILTLDTTATNMAGLYSVAVGNLAGSTNSLAAVLGLEAIDTCAVVTLYGPVGTTYRVDWSDAMTANSWQVLTNVVLPYSPYVIVDANSTHSQKRFYRAVLVP